MAEKFSTVDEYIAAFPPDIQEILVRVRAAVHVGLPGAEEKIRYGMPAVMLGGRYGIHFAGWKKHIGLYPVPVFSGPLETEIAGYRAEKDSVNFKYADGIPYDLIERVSAEIGQMRRDG